MQRPKMRMFSDRPKINSALLMIETLEGGEIYHVEMS